MCFFFCSCARRLVHSKLRYCWPLRPLALLPFSPLRLYSFSFEMRPRSFTEPFDLLGMMVMRLLMPIWGNAVVARFVVKICSYPRLTKNRFRKNRKLKQNFLPGIWDYRRLLIRRRGGLLIFCSFRLEYSFRATKFHHNYKHLGMTPNNMRSHSFATLIKPCFQNFYGIS